LRDLVASKASGSEDEPVGSPIQAQQRQWCGADQDGQCPGLACELQIRCPLPVLDSTYHDSFLKNAKMDAQVQQIPPVPPDML
jgi:hypothetical protein